jgi:serine protease
VKRVSAFLLLILASCTTDEPLPEDGAWLDQSDIQFDVPILPDALFASDRIIIGFMGEAPPDSVEENSGRFARLRKFEGMQAGLYRIESGNDVRSVVAELRASGRYRWVEPDYVRTISVNDPYRSYQWNFDAINAEAAWGYSTGLGAVVAVIDTGVSSGSSDGIGSLTSGYDFVNSDSNAADDNGHGTHVAGTIAQATDNSSGVAGLAYDATIMPIKVLDSSGSGYVSDTVLGINYAVTNGADVINLSLGSTSYSSAEAAAVANAYSNGVFVAAATGNSGGSSVDYPAAYSDAVAVGATRYGNTLASYSNRGSAVDLVAPGGDTSRDDNGDGYADGVLQETFSGSTWSYYFFQGTSMATPHVAAAAAMLMAEGATNADAEAALTATATDLGSSGWDSSYGYGLIQPDAALALLSSSVDDDGDGYDTSTDCDDTDSAINPGATEVCEDGIDNDCDGVDDTCSTGPTISGVSYYIHKQYLYVSWTTDEDTTGELCTSRGSCAYTSSDTSHSVQVQKKGNSFTIEATNSGGDIDTLTQGY